MRQEQALSKSLGSKDVSNIAVPSAAVSFAGKWKNQYGSIAEFTVNGSEVSGKYTSLVSGTNQTIEGPIRGYLSGDIIAFSVLWPTTAGSITTWVGQIVDVGALQTLKSLWHLVVNIPDADEATGLWTTIYSGADEFQKI